MTTSFWSLINQQNVVIPIIQRDYAQGRSIKKAPAIRKRFLNTLIESLNTTGQPLSLDFVYGFTKPANGKSGDQIKNFTPLDGQQRLTTLFLLHWYIAAKEGKLSSVRGILNRFTYETRQSSREFCKRLVAWEPYDFNQSIKKQIIDEAWFFTAWKHDPTIDGMLTMLEEIHERLKGIEKEMWPLLIDEQSAIQFHLLPMNDLGLPDELYIKMNARGKELTDFEYFKSRFSELLSPEQATIFQQKADTTWSDLFWNIYSNDSTDDIAKKVDNAFLRFFDFTTIVLASINDIVTSSDEERLDVSKKVYQHRSENADLLFEILDIFYKLSLENQNYFSSIFYLAEQDFCENKVRLFFGKSEINLFAKCADKYEPNEKINPFSISEQLMLFAVITHLLYGTEGFTHRIRKLRNLIASSAFRLRRENLPELLKNTAHLIKMGAVANDSAFDAAQVEQEKEKQKFIEGNSGITSLVFRIEDHQLLQGNLAILDLDPAFSERAQVFMNTFKESSTDYSVVIDALLTKGDYSRIYGQWHLLGNGNDTTWRTIFTTGTGGNGFSNTKKLVTEFIDYRLSNPSLTLEDIKENFLVDHEQPNASKDWRYYFIKYSEFRHNYDGYYFFENEKKPYEFIMLKKTQRNGHHWSPFLFTLNEEYSKYTILEKYGDPLYFTKEGTLIKIENKNEGYLLEAQNESGKLLLEGIKASEYLDDKYLRAIPQVDGLDIEDRVQKGKSLIEYLIELTTKKKVEAVA